jgi:hypothetical protein
MSLPPASQPWRPKARPAATNTNNNNANGGNQNNNNNNNNNSRQGSFETDGQISNRTGTRGQSHVQQTFQKYGQQGGGYNNNNNDTSSSIPMPQSRQQQQAKALAAAAAAQNQPQNFNVEDALDAFENIKVSPLAERATDWAPVSDSGVTYEPVHKDIASFYKMCSDAQKNKK